jgi:hypothetical protein
VIKYFQKYFQSQWEQTSNAPISLFRAVFGLMMFIGVIRFWINGWIETQYIKPKYFFPFYGFEWIKPLPSSYMYIVFILMAVAALFVCVGLFYRVFIWIFFFLFSYVEVLDKTNYLNHYYFIMLVSFLMGFIPANKRFSLDVKFKLTNPVSTITSIFPSLIKWQMAILYLFAGIAKLNYDWLFMALPISIWLPAKSNLPLIGNLMYKKWFHFLVSWTGAIYDLVIPFLLLNKKWVYLAYFFVILFHLLTFVFFPVIGMFPFIMIVGTLVFLPNQFHEKILAFFEKTRQDLSKPTLVLKHKRLISITFILYFTWQFLLPFRYVLYPGSLFWTEQGFRFSWRVMLMEKNGTAFFYVLDKKSGKSIEVTNSDFLTKQQEKMMATQPDMILQYAIILGDFYKNQGLNPSVYVKSYVNLNGSGSKLFINPDIDLYQQKDSFKNKSWILPIK